MRATYIEHLVCGDFQPLVFFIRFSCIHLNETAAQLASEVSNTTLPDTPVEYLRYDECISNCQYTEEAVVVYGLCGASRPTDRNDIIRDAYTVRSSLVAVLVLRFEYP